MGAAEVSDMPTTVTALGVFLVALAALLAISLARDIWAAVRSYRRERAWDLRAQDGDATAKLIVEIRDGLRP